MTLCLITSGHSIIVRLVLEQNLDKSTLSKYSLDADKVEKSATSQAKLFHTLMTRSAKNSDLALYSYFGV